MLILVALYILIGCAIASRAIIRKKTHTVERERRGRQWFALGCIGGPITLLAAIGMPNDRNQLQS